MQNFHRLHSYVTRVTYVVCEMIYDEDLHEIGNRSAKLNNQVILPCASLQQIVHRYFIITEEETFSLDTNWYILPDNSAHLIFYLFGNKNSIIPQWTVIGPRSKHTIINRKNRLFTFICTFRPGGLRPLTDIPVNEFRDLPVNSSDVLRNYQSAMFERLTYHALRFDVTAFIKCLEESLKCSLTSAGVHPAIRGLYEKFLPQANGSRVASISKELGYSERQFRNIIQNNIGHSPKLVQQIERFTGSLKLRKSTENWASIAHSSGYYDQSHMISDYQKLVGVSPERLLF
jgi:AraC-like DNA-binding protein